ncbi:amidohydrolase [Tetragenococcus muriaticus]|uniref:Cytosine deaminase n=1 Tax=Tetragenococcus muriaticus 3MR10-3 TaxID=1302648 RepID=A0A091C1T3_9ENTE|nr:amidohydrolase [Tetragenococcus muriaticus]KFN90869.1 cytosine deaminase [Tetragenococcus muriaticus 3MR10-3]GMA47063.1 deaminase [Tetragenococcus muriaticus]
MAKWLQNVKIETDYIKEGSFISGTNTQVVDLFIENDEVSKTRPHQKRQDGYEKVDGQGYLILPGIQEKHCHFDKSKLGASWRPITPAASIVERFTKEIEELNELDVAFSTRMKKLIEKERRHGVSFFRSHIDVHPKVGQKFLQQTIETLQDYKGMFASQLVAFPQHGMLLSNAYEDVKTALTNGADLIGGVDPTVLDGNTEKSLYQTFDLATQFNAPVDIHVHERGEEGKKTFYELLKLTKESHWQNKVTISHAFGLNDFIGNERKEFFQQLVDQQISVISSVPLNGVIPPLEELRQFGVDVSLGCDNVYDSWSPFGNGNVLEKLNRYAEIFNITTQDGLTDCLELVTGKKIVGDNLWLQEGDEATFTLVDSSCSAEFVARQSKVCSSYYKGKLVFSS